MDEPTNDMDITTLRIFAFEEEGRLKQSEGGYTDYVNRKRAKLLENSNGLKTVTVTTPIGTKVDKANWNAGRKKKLKFTYQEQKDYETIESDIASLEEKIEALEQEIPKYSRDFVKLNELMSQKEQCEAWLEEKMERWMYLEELAARIEAGEEIE